LLYVTTLLFISTTTHATNLDNSTIEASPSDVYELHTTTIKVTAIDTEGSVEGATVNISAVDGKFVDNSMKWIEVTTDANGEATVDWIAPATENETSELNVTITAEFTSGSDSIIKEMNITVHPIELDLSTISITPDPVYEMQNATVEVVAEGQYGVIKGADVHFECDDGIFPEYGTSTVDLQTDSQGKAIIIWQADLVNLLSNLVYVNITANITYTERIVNFNLTDTVNVNEVDFDNSVMSVSATSIGGGYPVTITVTAEGSLGKISGASISLDALDGQFPNGETTIEGLSDSNGEYETTWTAPDVSSDIDIIITATLTLEKTIAMKQIEKTITVTPIIHNFTNIEISANNTEVNVGQKVELTINVLNEIGDPVTNASATITAVEGVFVSSGTETVKTNTSDLGTITVVWDTSSLNPPITGQYYPITVSLVKEYYDTNSTSINIKVNLVIVQLETQTVPAKTSITQGENLTFTVLVTANGHPVENATVTITALSGVFASSGNQIASANTNSSGYVTFIWVTADMVVSTAKNYTFTITAGLPGYDSSDTETVIITVNPVSSNGGTDSTETPTEKLSTMAKLGILFGVTGVIALMGIVGYFVIKGRGI